ncbi:MAG: S-layer homology domain-containing protein [Elainellaceae cyanobacterium]
MTNLPSPEPRPPRDERNDELIASVVAFAVIGSILYWGIERGDRPSTLDDLDLPFETGAIGELDRSDEFDLEAAETDPSTRTARLPFGRTPIVETDAPVRERVDEEELEASPRVIQSLPVDASDASLPAGAIGGAALVAPPVAAELAEEDLEPSVAEEPVAEAPPSETAAVEDPPPADPAATDASAPAEFTDVASDYWAFPFIAGLSQAEVISGFGDGNFQPDQPITRAEFASLLNQSFDLEAATDPASYTDVASDYWAAEAIAQVTQAGFMSGYPGNDFQPDQQVSKAEVLVSLVSGLDLLLATETASLLEAYGDRDQVADWAAPRIAAATDAGLVVNHPNADQLNPNQPTTRAEAAAMIYQALAQQNQVDPVDSPFIVER